MTRETEPQKDDAGERGPHEEREELEELEAAETEPQADQRELLEERLKRAMADMANFRKRQFKDLEDARRRTLEGLATELLPVVDNFYLALEAHDQQQSLDQQQGDEPPDGHALAEGVKMVRSLLLGVLERHGLVEIPAEGQEFDPRRHEAVGVDEESDVEPNRITKVVQRGYALGDRVLRASRVIVSGQDESER
jgi:molecular chaperone GrpE